MSGPTGHESGRQSGYEPEDSIPLRPRAVRSRLAPAHLWTLLFLFSLLTAGCGSSDSGDASGADSTKTEADASDGGDADGKSGNQNEDDDGKDRDDSEEDDGEDKNGGDEKADKPKREKTTSVQAAKVVRGNLVIPVVAEGRIRARKAAEIHAEISGRVDRILVQEGSRVRRGQVLVRLDGREYEVAIAEARSRYLGALSLILVEEERLDAASNASADLEKDLVDLWEQERRGKITRSERLDREREIEIKALKGGALRQKLVEVRTGLASAKADEERARLNLERTEIRAPFAGVVTDLDIQTGERASAGTLICNLVNNTEVEAEVGVLESDLRGLEVGRAALLAIPALAETLKATVDVIAPEIDPDTRTCRVLLRYTSEDGRVRPGMFVRASIAGQTFEDRILVPREAILMRDNRPLVFKIEDNRAKWVYVTTGLQNDRIVEIKSVIQGGPLDPGTKVITSDHLTLTENAKVKVSKTRGLGDPWALASRTDS